MTSAGTPRATRQPSGIVAVHAPLNRGGGLTPAASAKRALARAQAMAARLTLGGPPQGHLASAIPILSIPLDRTGGYVAGIPELNQLNEPTLDGAADENARDNCVFVCNAMLSRFLAPTLQPPADGDAIKDSIPAYGPDYVGFSSQDRIIAAGVLEHRWGIHSYRLNAPGGSRANLLAAITALADQGVPSIVTIPSLWGSEPRALGYNPDLARDARGDFYCHACIFAGTLPDGTCILVNPWGGVLMYYSPADMAARLCFLCAYPVIKAGGGVIVANWTPTHDGAGNLTGAVDTKGHHEGPGLFSALTATASDALANEVYGASFGLAIPGVSAWLPLADDSLAIWTGSAAEVVAHGGQLVNGVVNALASSMAHAKALQGQVDALTRQVAALQASQPASTPAAPASPATAPTPETVIADLKAVLGLA